MGIPRSTSTPPSWQASPLPVLDNPLIPYLSSLPSQSLGQTINDKDQMHLTDELIILWIESMGSMMFPGSFVVMAVDMLGSRHTIQIVQCAHTRSPSPCP